MWNVEYWDDSSHQWHVGLTTGHQDSAEQLVSWLTQIGWESRVDEGAVSESAKSPGETDRRSRSKRFWLSDPATANSTRA